MLRTLIKKELLSNLVSLRFALIFLLCCTLILVSAYTMRGKYNERMEEYSAAVSMRRQELANMKGEEIFTRLGIKGVRLDKPPLPLSVLIEGTEGVAGKFATVNILSDPTLDGGAAGDSRFIYFGTLDIMYIVKVVLSLVAILLTYDAISGEREYGTLKLALSNSVPRHAVLLSKCIGGYITLLLPFLVPVLIGLLILTMSGNIVFSGAEWCRLGLILLASLLYIGVFIMLGLLVSSRTGRSSTSLMILLLIWVVIVLAVPKVSVIIAGKLRRVPSVQEIQAKKDATMAQTILEFEKKREQLRKENRGISQDERQELEDEMQAKMLSEISKRQGKIQVEYNKQKAAQFRMAISISRASPASSYTYAAADLAGTGFDRQERFLTAAMAYQEELVKYFSEMSVMERDDVKIDMDRLPILDFREPSTSESWEMVWIDILILFLFGACFFMIAYVGFVRSDVK